MEKKCTKCEKVKDFDEFGISKNTNDGKGYNCRLCREKYRIKNKKEIKEYSKGYYLNNKEKIAEYDKKYRKDNKEKNKVYAKKYHEKNKELRNKKCREYQIKNKENINKNRKIFRENNKEKIAKYDKEYRKKNKQKITQWQKEYTKSKKETNKLFKLKANIRTCIIKSLKSKGYTKNTKTYNMLKCDFEFFMQWLNGIASNGYTYGIGNLHLDHVVPISLAKTENEALLLSHYSNFQLLTAHENFVKGNRFVNPIKLSRVLENHPEPNTIKEIFSRLT